MKGQKCTICGEVEENHYHIPRLQDHRFQSSEHDPDQGVLDLKIPERSHQDASSTPTTS